MNLSIGTRIYYSGEVMRLTRTVTASAEGVIIGTRATDRWGDDYVVRLDDGRKLRVPATSFEGEASQRTFWPLREWLAQAV